MDLGLVLTGEEGTLNDAPYRSRKFFIVLGASWCRTRELMI